MPSAVGSLLSSDRFNWNYVSDPEPYLDGRRLTHPRGRVLGGSSSINGMVYIRGHARDYDGWAESGLSRLGAMRRCCRTSSVRSSTCTAADDYHGGSGPLAGVRARPVGLAARRRASCRRRSRPDMGSRPMRMASARKASAASTAPPRKGRRCERRSRLSRPAAAAGPNLTILTGSLVHRVIFEVRATGAPIGVEYSRGRGSRRRMPTRGHRVGRRRSIRPSSCSYRASAPPPALSAAGIAPLHDLPAVGANLNDHPDIVIQHRVR